MSEKIYRFLYDEIGIYEAVDQYCPRDDKRRKEKPDGSWLPKVGQAFSGAISFWTKEGMAKYKCSGLCDWHMTVVPNDKKKRFQIVERPEEVLYEDEYQVILKPEQIKVVREAPFTYEGPTSALARVEDERPKFIRNANCLRDWNAYSFYPGSLETFCLGAAVGEDLGLKRLGIWHEYLRPGHRSSWPHAHSHEEELVYVLKGHPEFWINGEITKTNPGDSVFFAPGSGFTHTVLNSSSEPCELLVVGEQKIKEDKIFYAKHLERNAECKEKGIYWEGHPDLSMGDHSGEPKMVGDSETNPSSDQLKEFLKKHFSSTEDVEVKDQGGKRDKHRVFSRGRDLGRAMGAKKIALHHTSIPSGFRSGIPHAESEEEEFIYVLRGKPKAWVNGRRIQLSEGDCAAFPSGTGIAHTFLNDTWNEVQLIVIGETWKPDNKCVFPLNPDFKEQMPQTWWDDAPLQDIGNDSPIP